ncbi:hypothetical protein [Asanoa iriomotensis]|uniref:DUF222 domain-containing protein n=1 Tax=Asanoa iriomotensis TaxID=234613 RepID=A0ABQ4CG01_9ACTN|nr:hypothetical protein [Asanoa iriomotensis]GIF61698.1 hypothetical protein Air01nite_77930 [Asanoa iriomotensis]
MTTTTSGSHRSDSADPAALFAAIEAEAGSLFAAMEWADDEIAAAVRRHPAQADLLYHAFGVLMPRDIGPGMNAEFVYRGHARELLDRVAAGTDLCPATAAEICLTLAEVSQQAPMHGSGAGLYFRMWLTAFPEHLVTADQADNQSHYEHLYGPQIDELEATMRRKAADTGRQLGDIECEGRHHGRSVSCRFTSSRRPAP